jgi:hypothetical protein
VPDSADDHEALHAYSLPGIVTYARNALLSANAGRMAADAKGLDGVPRRLAVLAVVALASLRHAKCV